MKFVLYTFKSQSSLFNFVFNKSWILNVFDLNLDMRHHFSFGSCAVIYDIIGHHNVNNIQSHCTVSLLQSNTSWHISKLAVHIIWKFCFRNQTRNFVHIIRGCEWCVKNLGSYKSFDKFHGSWHLVMSTVMCISQSLSFMSEGCLGILKSQFVGFYKWGWSILDSECLALAFKILWSHCLAI